MKLRAFVVMPFGIKTAVDDEHNAFQVDFNRVYNEFIEPALKEAGCEPFRADSEVSAGDIRTGMFFELVTADIVVADLSIPNPNVYYELGIRDAVSPRGVFIIQGGWSVEPFDVASDRSFLYPGKLFALMAAPVPNIGTSIDIARNKLAEQFKDAVAVDEQSTGSPLYAHLPGLKPVDWENIQTAKARYFSTLRHNWEEKVKQATDLHRPGNIITLAEDAPTRMHRIKILACAARSLIGLCFFNAAEEVLQEILKMNPDDLDAQHQLSAVLSNLGEVDRAENQMNRILEQQKDSEFGLIQGMIYRVKWYLQWTNDPNPRRRAVADSRLLVLAIESFHRAQRRDPGQYLGGYNALLLIAVVADLFGAVKPVPPILDVEELTTVVRYTANVARERAEVNADYDTLFWSAVCLSGLAMIQNDQAAALQWIQEACDLPSTTLFYLQTFQERLTFLEKLQFRAPIVKEVQKVVSEKLAAQKPDVAWTKVVVFAGYELGESSRFPLASAGPVETKIKAALEQWNIGPGDLAVCAGTAAGDVMFGRACLQRGAHVRLLMMDQAGAELAEAFVDPIASLWLNASYELADHPETEVWFHSKELGPQSDTESMRARNNRWIINTARMETASTKNKTSLYALVLWDGTLRVDDPNDPSFFIAQTRKFNPYRGGIIAIDPARELMASAAQHP